MKFFSNQVIKLVSYIVHVYAVLLILDYYVLCYSFYSMCLVGCLEISDPQNGQLKGPVRSLYKPGEELTVKCNEGYAHLGVSVLTCLENGSWSGTIPTCVGKR